MVVFSVVRSARRCIGLSIGRSVGGHIVSRCVRAVSKSGRYIETPSTKNDCCTAYFHRCSSSKQTFRALQYCRQLTTVSDVHSIGKRIDRSEGWCSAAAAAAVSAARFTVSGRCSFSYRGGRARRSSKSRLQRNVHAAQHYVHRTITIVRVIYWVFFFVFFTPFKTAPALFEEKLLGSNVG